METVSNTVHKLRKNKGLTQEELAKKAGVTRQTIIALEKGNYVPSVLLSIKLSKVFKTRVEDLFRLKKK